MHIPSPDRGGMHNPGRAALLKGGLFLRIRGKGEEMGISKRELREERQRMLKKDGVFLIKDIWEFKGELILYGKVSSGLITDQSSFCFPRANGRSLKVCPDSMQYNERNHVPYYIKWACEGAPVILRFRRVDLSPDVRVRRWQTIGT